MERKLYRSDNKMLAGVCAGLAEFLGIDPTIVRLIWAAMVILGGTGILLYIICWFLIPKRWM